MVFDDYSARADAQSRRLRRGRCDEDDYPKKADKADKAEEDNCPKAEDDNCAKY